MNIAFIKKVVNGVTYSRAELTPLGNLEFAKTLKGTDEELEDFLYMEDCQRIPNMNKQGWEDVVRLAQTNPQATQALQSLVSWVRIKGILSNQ